VTRDAHAAGVRSHREILVVFAGLAAGMFLPALNVTIVATTLPAMVGDLGGLSQLSWVVTAYLLAATVAVPCSTSSTRAGSPTTTSTDPSPSASSPAARARRPSKRREGPSLVREEERERKKGWGLW
jgi:hypothetical protein